MKKVCIVLAVYVAAVLAGCATEPIEQPPEMYWPTPPETPRVKFLDYILGSLDVKQQRKGKFKEALFGDEKDVSFIKPTYIKARGGVVYIADVNSIHIYDYKNKKFSLVRAGFRSLTGIGLGADGSLYVGDSFLRAVYRISPDMKEVFRFPQPPEGFGAVGGLAVDRDRNLVYIVNAGRHRVDIFDTDGNYIKALGQRGIQPGEFNFPYDIAVDNEGNLIVLDSGNFRVQVFSPDGKPLVGFGGVGVGPGMFSRPRGVAVDNDGHIYVTDATFGNFQIFDYAGNHYLVVGKNGSSPGRFLLPMGIYIDESDKIYVVDQANKRIQIFQYLRPERQDEAGPP